MPVVLALEDAGQDLGGVGLVALRGDARLPGPAAVEVGQQVLDREREPGRAAVDDDDVARPVALAGGGDAEGLPKELPGMARGC